MSSRLPEFVDPWRFADQRMALSGQIELASLRRVAEASQATPGEVQFSFRFDRDEARRVRITGSVQATLILECQRCLEPMSLAVDATIDLGVIEVADEAQRLPASCEPVQVEDGLLRLSTLVEDELLLAIPQVPMHDVSQCSALPVTSGVTATADVAEHSSEQRDNPFAVLAGLKIDRSD